MRFFRRQDSKLDAVIGLLKLLKDEVSAMAQGQSDFQASLTTLTNTIATIAASQAKALADAKAAWEADDDAKFEAAHSQLDTLNQQLQNVQVPAPAPTPAAPATS